MGTRATILNREMDKLKQRFLLLGGRVEQSLRQAVQAARERDTDLARKVIETDDEIDTLEVELEEECLKILALHQPVAVDLRFIVAILKINNDLERVGDLAANVAEHALFLAERPPLPFPFDFEGLAERVQAMVRLSLDALVNQSAAKAQEVRLADDEVDRMHHETYGAVERLIREQPEHLASAINLLGLSRRLERVADQATNIAEDVIYLVEGEIVRHTDRSPRSR
jgi:phosphate transport system protein